MNSAGHAIGSEASAKSMGRCARCASIISLRPGQTVALLGFDRAAAEVLVNLITAATLPDAGEVDVFGSPTNHVTDFDAWVRLLDRFGILSERVALIDELTVEQNLALPLSLEVVDMAAELRRRVENRRRSWHRATERTQPMRGADAGLRMRAVSARPWRSIRGFSSRSIPMLRSHRTRFRASAPIWRPSRRSVGWPCSY